MESPHIGRLTGRRCEPYKHNVRITPMRIPAATLVLLGGLLFLRHREVQRMEAEIGFLRERISQPRIPVIQPEPDAGSFPINWQDLARKQPHLGGDYAGMKTRIRLKQTLLNLSAGELAAALDDLLAADLAPGTRETYAWLLLGPLIQLVPETALERCIHSIRGSKGEVIYALTPALEAWARRDPQAAIAWFDAEVAAGTFLGKGLQETDLVHNRFERLLIAALVESDPPAARHRGLSMPLEVWSELLRSLGRDTVSPAGFASLVRDTIPSEKDRISLLGQPAYSLGRRKGYGGVSGYMDEIDV